MACTGKRVVVLELVLYEKEHCSLCDHAREVVEDVLDDLGEQVAVTLRRIDIRSDEALFARYRHDVPVLACAGVDWFHHRIDAALLAARLVAPAAAAPAMHSSGLPPVRERHE